jgi:hypothetical protein
MEKGTVLHIRNKSVTATVKLRNTVQEKLKFNNFGVCYFFGFKTTFQAL